MTIKPRHAMLLLLIIAIIPLFAQLDTMPLNQWDEARLGVSAIEMLRDHNWLIPHYCGAPDMWSTKPPLMIWCQLGAIKVFGLSELAIRLPSAIAGLLTALLLFFFFDRKYKLPLLGLLCATVLLLTQGYIHAEHSVRTGDYDALLTLFTTAYCLSFFLFLDEGRQKYIYATFVFITLAVFTKSVQGLIFMPVLLLFALYRKKLVYVLKNKGFYAGLICCVSSIAAYYLLREHYNHGYLATVAGNELGGRYAGSLEHHNASVWDMLHFALIEYVSEWYLLIIPAIIIACYSAVPRIKDIGVYASLLAVLYLVVIFGAKTMVPWYIMPAYPFLAVLIGLLLYQTCTILYGIGQQKNILSRNVLPLVFLSLVLITPYAHMCIRIFTQVYDEGLPAYQRDYISYLQDALHNPGRHDNSYVTLNIPINQSIIWYIEALEQQHRPVTDIRVGQLKPGMNVIPGSAESRKYIDDHFNTHFNWQNGALAYYTIISPRAVVADTVHTLDSGK